MKTHISTRPDRRHWPRVLATGAGAGFLWYDHLNLHLLHHLLGGLSPVVVMITIVIVAIWVIRGKVVRDTDEQWAREQDRNKS